MTDAADLIVRALAQQRAPRDNEFFHCTMCEAPDGAPHTPACPWRMAVEFVGESQALRDPMIRSLSPAGEAP